jgi:hypothetical protein
MAAGLIAFPSHIELENFEALTPQSQAVPGEMLIETIHRP